MIAAVITDVEGTTTPVTFVRDVLFPRARAALPAMVRTRAAEPAVRAALDDAKRLAGDAAMGDDDVLAVLLSWMDADWKHAPLKTLQGLLWAEGYRRGEITAPLYADVPGAVRRWRAGGKRVYVYSSGSVLAQRLLFGHTDHGDLVADFDGFFDTAVGPKSAKASYRAIAESIGVTPAEIAFLSDSRRELDAARDAGLATVGIVREPDVDVGDHARAGDLDQIMLADHVELLGTGAHAAFAGVPALARRCHARHWTEATSGNFSVRLDATRFAITRSGVAKGATTPADLVVVDALDGLTLAGATPSAETPLHAALYRARRDVGAVAHTHSLAATVLSRRYATAGALRLAGYEIAKGLSGVSTHETEIVLPIVANSQDVTALAHTIGERLAGLPDAPGYLVAGHGLTTWAADLATVERHLEALELMLAAAMHER